MGTKNGIKMVDLCRISENKINDFGVQGTVVGSYGISVNMLDTNYCDNRRNEIMKNENKRRNRIEISVKGLVLAVVVIIALVLSAISLYMVTRSKGTINDGNTQYSLLMSDYSEISATLYDGLYVSGDKVIDVISDSASALNEGVVVVTLAGAGGGTTTTYNKNDGYTSANPAKSDNTYINPAGTFVGEVKKNANGMVTSIVFTQTN